MKGKQQKSRQIKRRNRPAVSFREAVLFWKGKNKVQEQRGLQQPRSNIAPVNRPVKRIQLAAVVKGVKGKRDQAENVEMSRARSSPAAEQHIQPDSKVNQPY